MTRQEYFEKHWADTHDVPVETMARYRWQHQDGYRLPGMAAHYRTFCAALDSIVIDLSGAEVNLHDGGAYLDICTAQEIIETYGVKCK